MRITSLSLILALAALLALGLFAGCSGVGDRTPTTTAQATPAAAPAEAGPAARIVVFKAGAATATARRDMVRAAGGEAGVDLALIRGLSAGLTPAAERALGANPNVLRIDPDVIVTASPGKPTKPTPTPQPPQVQPWGVDRIDAEVARAQGVTGAGVKVAVLDTGIQADHPDLAANVKGGANFVSTPPWKPANASKWADDNGHGTHVAGIIAAVDNTIGVVGVAPQASLYAVKALDKSGSGYLSWIIAGLQWCGANGIQVVNMSLGTASDVQSFHDACDQAHALGIKLVAAAGNENAAVSYPAAYASVIAVAAVDRTDTRAWFSNFGPQIAVAAPGVDVFSTYLGSAYQTLSGTSMAAPHATGTLALKPDVSLTNTADDLLPAGFDVYTGYGLVDAEKAALGTQTGNNLP
ncbi:S8 family peptidase [bacterium]|nr:S8 family peptidase [bacterium]